MNQKEINKLRVESVKKLYESKRDAALCKFFSYSGNPTNVGEHSDISEEIVSALREYTDAVGLLESLESISKHRTFEEPIKS